MQYLISVLDDQDQPGSSRASARSIVASKGYLAGVRVWEAPDLKVALKLATDASQIRDGKIEVRPLHRELGCAPPGDRV
jgi:hypothetical protein